MGLISKIIEKTAKIFAIKTAENVAYKTITAAEETDKKKKEKFLADTKEGHSKLTIVEKANTFIESFNITDNEGKIRYIVKGKLLTNRHCLTLYSVDGKVELGKVLEQRKPLIRPVANAPITKDFVIEMNNKVVGEIETGFILAKREYELSFNNWKLHSNSLGTKYKLTDNENNKIMDVQRNLLINFREALLDVYDLNNEILCILIFLAIDSARTSKSQDRARAFRHII